MKEIFLSTLQSLGTTLGLELVPNEEGVLTLSFDEKIDCTVHIPPESEFIFFYSPILVLSETSEKEKILRDFLALNFFALSLPGLFLSLDPKTDEILLCYLVHESSLQSVNLEIVLSKIIEENQSLRQIFSASARGRGEISKEVSG